MKVIIDIPEPLYKEIMIHGRSDDDLVCSYIQEGILLEKGHGRIIDESCIPMEENFNGVRAYFPFMAPTIVPEDSDDDSWKSRSDEYFEYKVVKDGETLVTGLRSLEQARTWVSSHGDPEDYLIYLVRVTKEKEVRGYEG